MGKDARGLTFGGQNSRRSLGEVRVEPSYLGRFDERKPMTAVSGKPIPGEPVAGKLCAAGRGAESLTQSGEARRNASGSSDLSEGESLGDKSLSEKQGTLEDAEGIALQDPRDMAKARLPESQSPAVEPHTRCYSV
jgi:hypothetical protein